MGHGDYANYSRTEYQRLLYRNKKAYLVSLAGGKCVKCGYSECLAALGFHHINPEEKDCGKNSISSMRLDRAIGEIKKCILVCANCHAEIHYKLKGEV